MSQPVKSTLRIDDQAVEVYVEPLLPPGKTRGLLEEEDRNELAGGGRGLGDNKKTDKHLQDTKYMKYLKERKKKEINRFNWGVCFYKCCCCWRDKPPQAYFYYGPQKKLDPKTAEEYRKPYKETSEMAFKRKIKEALEQEREAALKAELEEKDRLMRKAKDQALEAGYGFGPGYAPGFGPGYGPGYGPAEAPGDGGTGAPGARTGDAPVRDGRVILGRKLDYERGVCKCHENVRLYRMERGYPPDVPEHGGPGQPGGPGWLPPAQMQYARSFPEYLEEFGGEDLRPCDVRLCVCGRKKGKFQEEDGEE